VQTALNKNIFKQNNPEFNMNTKDGNSGGSFFLPKNKKGQEMSTTTIILIILGVIVLVVLVLGFRIGWDKVLPFLPSNNVQNVVTACSTACATGSQYDYCTAVRTLKADDLKVKAGVDAKQVLGDCKTFAKDPYTAYGIETCSTISC
jgi:hypothetical protein